MTSKTKVVRILDLSEQIDPHNVDELTAFWVTVRNICREPGDAMKLLLDTGGVEDHDGLNATDKE